MPNYPPNSDYYTQTPSNMKACFRSIPTISVPSVPNLRSPCLPLSPKISQNLFGVISKFEALDSISEDYKVPSLRPAPLQLPKLPRRKTTAPGIQQPKNFSAVSIPSSKTQSNNEEHLALDDLADSKCAAIFISTAEKNLVSNKGSESGQLRRKSPSHEINSTRSRPDNQVCGQQFFNYVTISQEQFREMGARTRSSIVKDMIRTYDRRPDNLVTVRQSQYQHNNIANVPSALGLDGNSKVRRSQQLTRYPENSPFRKQTNDDNKRAPSTPSTCQRSRPKTSSAKAAASVTSVSATCNHHSASKRQYKVFEDSINPFSVQKTSRSSIRNISPLISLKTELLSPKHLTPKLVVSPNHRLRSIRNNALEAVGHKPGPAKWDFSPEVSPSELRGRSHIPRAVRETTENDECRKISATIEDSRRGNQTKKSQNYKDGYEAQLSNTWGRRRIFDFDGVGQDIMATGRISKVADMKKIFDGKAVGKVDNLESIPHQSKMRKTSPPKHSFHQPPSSRLPLTPPAPLPRADVSKAPASVKPTLRLQTLGATPRYTVPEDRGPLPLVNFERPQVKNGTIREKIKLFQGVEPRGANAEMQGENTSQSRKAIESLSMRTRATVKPRGLDNDTDEDRDLSSKEVYEILKMFQEAEDRDRIARRDLDATKPSITPRSALSKGKAATPQLELSFTSALIEDMIVKEAECGLKEPKPVRLVAMQKMLWLCREKAVADAYKDKGRVLHSRRF